MSAGGPPDLRSRFFFVTCSTVALCAALHILPLPVLGRRGIALHASLYRVGLLNALVAHGYRLYYSTKLPASISADAIKALAAELVKSNTFLSFIYCALFFFGREVNWVLLPLGVTAAYQSLIFLSKHAAAHELWRRFGERAHAYAMANMEKALVLTAITEVGVGFMLLLQLLSPRRQVVRAFAYWNLFLRARYHCDDNSVYRIKFSAGSVAFFHRAVWQQIGVAVMPTVRRLPAAEKVVRSACTWFRGY